MAKFCPNCGTPCDDNAAQCMNCGSAFSAYETQQPAYQAPVAAPSPTGAVNQYIKIIIIAIAAIGLLVGIMNLFAMYDVKVTATAFGQKVTEEGPLSELREDPREEGIIYVLSTYVMGIVGLANAALAGYSFFLLSKNAPGSKKFFSRAVLVGVIGTVVALLMALLGCKIDFGFGVTATMGIHFTYWLSLIVNVAALFIDKSVLKNNCAPLQ